MPLHTLITSVYHLMYQVEGEEIEVELVGALFGLQVIYGQMLQHRDILTGNSVLGYCSPEK